MAGLMMSALCEAWVTWMSKEIVKTDSEVGFVLHTRPYRETSLLVDLFTKNYGRVRCVAKGL